MPEYRRHHYVPQFMLRRFASDDRQRAVRMHLVLSRQDIPRASIRRQCARPYLYGQDLKLEKLLGELEGAAAAVISQILDRGLVPGPFTDEDETLRLFVMFLWGRTPAAGAIIDDMATALMRRALTVSPSVPEGVRSGLEDIELVYPDTTAIPLAMAAENVPTIDDLRMKLLVNESDVEFILGDAPVARHNKWCERSPQSFTGFACGGLQIFVPLSPRHCLVLYDTDIYSVGPSSDDCVTFAEESFAASLNQLQFGYAKDAVFYRSSSTAERLRSFSDDIRPESGATGRTFDAVRGGSSLVMIEPQVPSVRLGRGPVQVRAEHRLVPHRERRVWRPEASAFLDERDRVEGRDRRPPLADRYVLRDR